MTGSRVRRRLLARGVGIAGGHLLDRAVGDPQRLHPVAGLGTAISWCERLLNDPALDSRACRLRGAAMVAALVGGSAGAGLLADRAAARAPRCGLAAEAAAVAAATWICLGGTTLLRAATWISRALETGDLDRARDLLPWLCGRDPQQLGEAEIARAVVESLAENTSDAHVAPLLWTALGGSAGALGYRAVNTLDAMVGYRSPRHLHFGWAAARLDDVANWIPARVAGLLTVIAAPLVGGSPAAARRAWRRDGDAHPSPNAGVVEAAAAGALGVRLGGRTPYPFGVEMRPVLGSAGRPVEVSDIARARALEGRVQDGAVALAVGVVLAAAVAAGA